MDRTVLFNLGYGLYVLTAREENKDNGCIINTVMQVTDTPLQLVVGINKNNLTHDMVMRTKKLNLSILSEKAPFSLFQHFGFQSGRDTDKFNQPHLGIRADNELMYLSDFSNGYLSCNISGQLDLGTHTLFVAEVIDATRLNDAPSMTYAYYHAKVKPKPAVSTAKGWRCKVCGYIYEGDPLPADFICPICKHGAGDFEKII